MRTYRKSAVMLFVLLGLAVGVATPTIAQGASVARAAGQKIVKGGTITVSTTSAWTSLDPANAATSQALLTSVGEGIYGTLFVSNKEGVVSPDLALDSTTNANGLVYTLHLRPGVKFQDGTSFNAAAVVYNIDRDLSSTGNGPAAFVALFNVINSVVAKGKTTVVFHLKHRDYLLDDVFAETAAGEMVSPTAVQQEGLTNFQLMPIGAGPFKVTSDQPGSSMTLVKNPSYWDKGEPYLDQVNVDFVSSDAAGYAGLVAGSLSEYEYTYIDDPQWMQQVRTQSSLSVIQENNIDDYAISTNIKRSPFDNPLAIKALDEATERLALINDVLPGSGAIPDWSFQPPGTLYFNKNEPFPGQPPYNLTQAQADVKTLGGVSFSVITSATTGLNPEIQEAFAKQWQLAGMNVSVLSVPHSTETVDHQTGNYNVLIGVYGTYYNPYFSTYLEIPSTAPNNAYGFQSSKIDSDLVRIQETPITDVVALKKIWLQLDTIEADEGAFQGSIDGPIDWVVNKKIHNFTVNGGQWYLQTVWYG